MKLGEYLGTRGFVELVGHEQTDEYRIFGLELVDRTVVYDAEFAIRRSRVGTQLRHDRRVTNQLRPLIDSLSPVAS